MRKELVINRGLGRVAAGLLLALSLALPGPAVEPAVEQRVRRDLEYLASEECEGRGVETEGLKKAATYIARQFEQAGLQPGGKDGTWFQPFTIGGAGELDGGRLVLRGPQGQSITLAEGKHFNVLGLSSSGKADAPVVFVGYGATAPRIGYDDYEGVDVKGKVVIALRRTPRYDRHDLPFDGDRHEDHAALVNKVANAQLHKAAAVLLVSDASELPKGDPLLTFKELANAFSTGSIPALHLKRSVADQVLVSSLGRGLADLEKAIDGDLKPRSADLRGWSAAVETRVRRKELPVKNVVGVLPGSGPLAKEYVVVGAHYDHLGYGERGTLAKTPEDRKKIHFGADDNASGTTAMIELARRFAARKGQDRRTLVFMAFSAEEKGLLGSRHYCKRDPLFPLADTAAMVNLDMVGRMQNDKDTGKGKLLVQGTGSAKDFDDLVERLNKKYDFQLSKTKGGNGPSDHDSFYNAEIPVLFFWTNVHSDYHRPTDTADRINVADMLRVTDFSAEVVAELAGRPGRPGYIKVASVSPRLGPTKVPRLGIQPAYDEDETKGLLLDAVTAGGPGAKAGLKAGDRIVAVADRPVTNINTYMVAMSQQKGGRPITLTVQRGQEKLKITVTPE